MILSRRKRPGRLSDEGQLLTIRQDFWGYYSTKVTSRSNTVFPIHQNPQLPHSGGHNPAHFSSDRRESRRGVIVLFPTTMNPLLY